MHDVTRFRFMLRNKMFSLSLNDFANERKINTGNGNRIVRIDFDFFRTYLSIVRVKVNKPAIISTSTSRPKNESFEMFEMELITYLLHRTI